MSGTIETWGFIWTDLGPGVLSHQKPYLLSLWKLDVGMRLGRRRQPSFLDAFLKACLIYTDGSPGQEWRNYWAPDLKKWGTVRRSVWQQSTFEEKRFYTGFMMNCSHSKLPLVGKRITQGWICQWLVGNHFLLFFLRLRGNSCAHSARIDSGQGSICICLTHSHGLAVLPWEGS